MKMPKFSPITPAYETKPPSPAATHEKYPRFRARVQPDTIAVVNAPARNASTVVQQLAELFRSAGYRVSGIVKDPMTWWASFIFYVDDQRPAGGADMPHPTAVRISNDLEVKFDGPLEEKLSALVQSLPLLR
jgi:hypothetical protein